MRVSACLATGLLVASTLLASSCRTYEVFVDGYGGPSFPEDGDIEVFVPELGFRGKLDVEGKATAGGRVGSYFDVGLPVELGLAVDASSTRQEAGPATMDAVPISFLGLVRAPIGCSAERPHGWLQPYFGMGPSIYVATASLDSIFTPGESSDVSPALDVRAGVAVVPLALEGVALGIFAEYRLTWAAPEFEWPLVSAQLDSVTHHALFGLSLRFGGSGS